MKCPPGWTCVDTGNSLRCVDYKDDDISFGKNVIFVFYCRRHDLMLVTDRIQYSTIFISENFAFYHNGLNDS